MRVRRGGAPTAASAGLWLLFSSAPHGALPREVEQEWGAAHMEQAAAPRPGCPGHCGKAWASGAVLWQHRGLFLQELNSAARPELPEL